MALRQPSCRRRLRQLRRRLLASPARGPAAPPTALLLVALFLLLADAVVHGFVLPAAPALAPAVQCSSPPRAATAPSQSTLWQEKRPTWAPALGAAASDDDDSGGDQDDEAAGEADVEQAAAVAAASPPPPTTRGGKRNLTATIPDLLGSRSLGLDWGHKKIGIGLSAGFSQRPLGTIPNAGGVSGNATLNRPTLDHILSLVKAEGAVRIVIGNPLFRDGTLSPQANTTKTFARLLANRAVELGMTQPWTAGEAGEAAEGMTPFVFMWDERLTSQAARVNIKTKAFLHSSSDVDSQAACLVLEDFYQARAYKAEIVWPDPGAQPPPLRGAARVEGEGAEGAGVVGGAGGGSAGARTHMSYDEWRRAERERYEASRLSFQQAAEERGEGEGTKKKKKKKKKK